MKKTTNMRVIELSKVLTWFWLDCRWLAIWFWKYFVYLLCLTDVGVNFATIVELSGRTRRQLVHVPSGVREILSILMKIYLMMIWGSHWASLMKKSLIMSPIGNKLIHPLLLHYIIPSLLYIFEIISSSYTLWMP